MYIYIYKERERERDTVTIQNIKRMKFENRILLATVAKYLFT